MVHFIRILLKFLILINFLASFCNSKDFQCFIYSGVCHIEFEKGDFSEEIIKISKPLHTVYELNVETYFGRIPEAIAVNFTNIQILSMTNCGIKSLDRVEMLPSLKILNVATNNLTELRKDNLGLTLERLYVQNNQIKILTASTFEDLQNLEELNLNDNFITSFEPNTFKNNQELKVLLADFNEIDSIEGAFTSELQLQRISLSKNFIKTITPKTFFGLSKLKELDLSRNLIHTVDENAFRTNIALSTLDLRRNYLTSFFLDVNSTDFYLLHLEQNQLEAIFIITQLTKLHYLSIFAGKNHIQQFHVQKNIPLMLLDLSTNRLQSIHQFNFNETSIDSLKLSNNNLTSMDFNYLRKCKSLRELHLNGTSLTDKQFHKILNKLTRLEYLDVSFNENLSQFNFTLVHAENLKDLKMNGCKIKKLHPKEMRKGMPNLKKLGISGNIFKCNKTKSMLDKLRDKNGYQILVELVETGPTIHGIGCEN